MMTNVPICYLFALPFFDRTNPLVARAELTEVSMARWANSGGQLGIDPRRVQDFCNPPNLMILRNGLLEIEAIEQLPLVPVELPHLSDLANARVIGVQPLHLPQSPHGRLSSGRHQCPSSLIEGA
jgi:hypothetical protein